MSLHTAERRTRLSLDTVLGFILPFFMALGVMLLSLKPGYQPELMSFLFGSILMVNHQNLLVISLIAVVMMVVRVSAVMVVRCLRRIGDRMQHPSGQTPRDQNISRAIGKNNP